MAVGTAIGLAMGVSRIMEAGTQTLLTWWLTFPALLMVLMSIRWLGVNEAAGVLAIAGVTGPIVVINIWAGTKAADRELHSMARAFG